MAQFGALTGASTSVGTGPGTGTAPDPADRDDGRAWSRPPGTVQAGLAALAGTGAAVDLAAGASIVHAASLAALVLVTGVATGLALRRWGLAVVAAATVAAWTPAYQADWPVLVVATLLAAALPVALTARPLEPIVALGAALVAGAWLFALHPAALGVAAGVSVVAAVLRPSAPTGEGLARLRTAALMVPAAGLVAALVVNATTGRADALAVRSVLAAGIGTALLLVLVALAGLGLVTLFESRDPIQVNAWLACVVAGSLVVASLALRDPGRTLETVAVGAAPLALLASLAAARFAHGAASPRRAALAVLAAPVVLALGQLVFLV